MNKPNTDNIEGLKTEFKDVLRNVVANAILKKSSGEPTFTPKKIVGQIEMTVDHFSDKLLSSERKKFRKKIEKMRDKNKNLDKHTILPKDTHIMVKLGGIRGYIQACSDILSLLDEEEKI